jgi:hypothetical protein
MVLDKGGVEGAALLPCMSHGSIASLGYRGRQGTRCCLCACHLFLLHPERPVNEI